MIPVLITKIKTSDGVFLEGIYVKPRKSSKTAVVWLHGLGSSFSQGQELMKELSSAFCQNGTGYFKFNTRGHDVVTGYEKPFFGDAFEKFSDSIFDIRAMILFAHKLGYRRIILAGHSTGANKILYYLYKTRDRRVKGLILLAPVSDVAVGEKVFGRQLLQRGLSIAERLILKNPLLLMPESFGILTAQRFWSLYHPGEPEDVFPYYNPEAKWQELKSIRVPVIVIFGSQDEYLNRSAKEIVETFRINAISTKSFVGAIIKDAIHGFQKREIKLSNIIIEWLKSLTVSA